MLVVTLGSYDQWSGRGSKGVNTETVLVRICDITLFPFKKEIDSFRINIT